ncbi:unnamed protein product [Withania somnifera]
MGRLFFFYSLLFCVAKSKYLFFLWFALVHFKQPFDITSNASLRCDTSYPKTIPWNESRDCCTWDGVTCDMLTGHVISLDISCSQLKGTIHPNSSLFQLHHLHALNLAHNDFYPSSIPNCIGRLRNLRHLNLSDSFFEGKITIEISYLSNLVSLDLSNIQAMLQNFTNLEAVSLSIVNISSPVPLNMSSSLRYVDLKDTNLRGGTESFFLLPNLEQLKLSGNDLLKGVLPKIHPSNTLLELDISYKGISGELPDLIGTLSSLNYLNLYGCDFSGPIPDSIGNLTQIREFLLSRNHFTGHIPSTISKLKQLSSNSFEGDIPDVFSNLQGLRYLDLSNNSFIVLFPSQILSLTRLKCLDLSSNSLSGPLPNNASMLQKLIKLDLSYNSLNGNIPSWVFSLPRLSIFIVTRGMRWDSLWYLNLSHNSLTGNQQFHYHNLEYLDLKFNFLQGPLPSFICNMSRLQFLDSSQTTSITSLSTIVWYGNRFEGSVPVSLLNHHRLEVLDVGNDVINDTFPAWLGTLKCYNGSLPADIFWNFKAMIKSDGEDTGEIKYMEPSVTSYYTSYENSMRLITTIMTAIDLSSNHFEGVTPKTLKGLGSLGLLNLSRNNLRGEIPMELGKLNMLEALDLSWNRLMGKIPRELTSINFLAGNLDLCGPPLSKECGTRDPSNVPQPLESKEEDESYFLRGFTWESVVIGYCFGPVVGTFLWSLMFKDRKPKWFVEFLEDIITHKRRRPVRYI